MNFISQPFALLLRAFYSFTKNYAVALIFFTLVVKLVFSFVNILQQKSAQGQARIRPKLNAIRNRYIGRTDSHVQIEFQSDLQQLYRTEKVSQSLGCLPLIIQLLIITILYQIICNPLTYIAKFSTADITAIKETIVANFGTMNISSEAVKKSVQNVLNDASVLDKVKGLKLTELDYASIVSQNPALFPSFADRIPDFTIFGGAIDLSKKPSFAFEPLVLIPLLTVVFQLASFFIIQIFAPKPDTSTPEAQQTAKTLMITNIAMTLVSGYIAFNFPAIVGLYWIYQSIMGTILSVVLHKVMPIPSYTSEEMAAIEAEYNKDYVRPEIPQTLSLHYIDDDDYETEDSEEAVESSDEDFIPERRKYDVNGNKIHSLHFIDEEDEENEEDTESDDDQKDTEDEN